METTTKACHLRTSPVACGQQVGELTKIVTFREFSYLTPTRILLAGCRHPSSLPALSLSRRDPGLEPVLDWQARLAMRFAAVAGPHRKATTFVIIARLASALVTGAGPLCCLGNKLGAFCMHCPERAVNHKSFSSHFQRSCLDHSVVQPQAPELMELLSSAKLCTFVASDAQGVATCESMGTRAPQPSSSSGYWACGFTLYWACGSRLMGQRLGCCAPQEAPVPACRTQSS